MKILSKLMLVVFLLCANSFSYAQHKVTFLLKQPSLLHSMDNLHVAGSFNLWNPADKNFQLKPDNTGIATITFSLPSGKYEYKFTGATGQKWKPHQMERALPTGRYS